MKGFGQAVGDDAVGIQVGVAHDVSDTVAEAPTGQDPFVDGGQFQVNQPAAADRPHSLRVPAQIDARPAGAVAEALVVVLKDKVGAVDTCLRPDVLGRVVGDFDEDGDPVQQRPICHHLAGQGVDVLRDRRRRGSRGRERDRRRGRWDGCRRRTGGPGRRGRRKGRRVPAASHPAQQHTQHCKKGPQDQEATGGPRTSFQHRCLRIEGQERRLPRSVFRQDLRPGQPY